MVSRGSGNVNPPFLPVPANVITVFLYIVISLANFRCEKRACPVVFAVRVQVRGQSGNDDVAYVRVPARFTVYIKGSERTILVIVISQ